MNTATVFEFDMFTDNNLFVQVNKVGGGTLGEAYDGLWSYRVSNERGQVIAEANDLHTGTPKTHRQAAEIVAEYFTPED